MGSAHARLGFTNSTESAQGNLLAPLDKLGTDFSALQFNARQEHSGTIQFAQLQETTAQQEHSLMDPSVQPTSPTAQPALLGPEPLARLLETAKTACISSMASALLSLRNAQLAWFG